MCSKINALLVFLAALCGIALSGCDTPIETIADARPSVTDAGRDGTVTETDAGTTDAPMLDICEQQSPPPLGAYQLLEHTWTCGNAPVPGNHMMWVLPSGADTWDCSELLVTPLDTMCTVECTGHLDPPANYEDLSVMRAQQGVSPDRFYYGIPGVPIEDAEFICYNPSTIIFGSALPLP